MIRILVIEDDQEISGLLERYFHKEGMDCVRIGNGLEAKAAFERNGPFQLVLLDLMLPGMDGLEVLRRIRAVSYVPVLIMTAKDGETDKIIGLGSGADDYIIKPFSIFELIARAKALIRRYIDFSADPLLEQSNPYISCGDLLIDPEQCSVLQNGVSLGLTATEFQIVYLLASHPKKVFTRENLYTRIWGEDYAGTGAENTISVHIRRLRSKIEEDPSMPRHIITVWGMGYKWGEI
ncbi:response regulator transcription factor [Paenibacillus sp. FSL L8-0340]|uniref:response regulator transcription factor n=1 Tax=Paenibacillus sp. FSL L8-0340 TaxID=2954685 RepID=UPI0031584D41